MIAIAFALEFEGAVFKAKQDRRLCADTWFLGATGFEAAQNLRRKLEKTRPKLLVSAGFAGGLQSGLNVGSLVLGENYSDPRLLEKLELSSTWQRGKIVTAAEIIEKAEDKRRLGETSGGLAGDLETAHIAEACRESDVAMLSIRCISDAVDESMPVPARVLLNPETYRPDPLALFQYLIANPSSVMGFNKLLKNAKTAQKGLASGLCEILPQVLRLV